MTRLMLVWMPFVLAFVLALTVVAYACEGGSGW